MKYAVIIAVGMTAGCATLGSDYIVHGRNPQTGEVKACNTTVPVGFAGATYVGAYKMGREIERCENELKAAGFTEIIDEGAKPTR